MSVLHGRTSDRETSVYRKDLGFPLCPVSLHCSALYTEVDCGRTVSQLNGTLTLSCLASDKGALYMFNFANSQLEPMVAQNSARSTSCPHPQWANLTMAFMQAASLSHSDPDQIISPPIYAKSRIEIKYGRPSVPSHRTQDPGGTG